jgi:tellurite resistance protein TehA-like permease
MTPKGTTRWRRRDVLPIRVTWIGLVAVLLLLIHKRLIQLYPMGITERAGLFVLVVVIPVALVSLWRAGLLPPERVSEEESSPK